MGLSGKGIQNFFFFVFLPRFHSLCPFIMCTLPFLNPGWSTAQIILKTCGFIVFKIHVKTVNRKSEN